MALRVNLTDPLFTDKFFDYKSAERGITVPFKLPTSLAELPALLSSDTEYKKGFTAVVDALITWLTENGINPAPCQRFKKNHLRSRQDPETFKFNFHIYDIGILKLSDIVTLLRSDQLPLDARKTIAKNLLTGINVCSGGALTHIYDAHLALQAPTCLPLFWMNVRHKLAEQVANECLKKYPWNERTKTGIKAGWETHYVIGVLNHYSAALGIKMIEDDYIPYCSPRILAAL